MTFTLCSFAAAKDRPVGRFNPGSPLRRTGGDGFDSLVEIVATCGVNGPGIVRGEVAQRVGGLI
jgi:hypothetical protein